MEGIAKGAREDAVVCRTLRCVGTESAGCVWEGNPLRQGIGIGLEETGNWHELKRDLDHNNKQQLRLRRLFGLSLGIQVIGHDGLFEIIVRHIDQEELLLLKID